MIGSSNTGKNYEVRARVLGYSLLVSLALHIGAAFIFIVAGGGVVGVDTTPAILVQDVILGPTISATNSSITSAPLVPPTENPAITPESDQKSAEQVQIKSPDQSSTTETNSSDSGLLSIPLGLGMTHGYFSGFADGRTLKDDIRAYYFEMVEIINREWWNQATLLKEPIRHDGIFDVILQRNGTIVSIQIKQGTGVPEADQILIEIIRKVSPLPPLPSTYDLGIFRAPLRIKAPSFLLRLGKNK